MVLTEDVGGRAGIFPSILPLDVLNDLPAEMVLCLPAITCMARLLPEIIIPLSLSWNTFRF